MSRTVAEQMVETLVAAGARRSPLDGGDWRGFLDAAGSVAGAEIEGGPPTQAEQTNSADAAVVVFGRFRFLAHSRELLVDGTPALLGSRALEVLAVLIEARGQLVTKDDLLNRVWPTTTVGDNCLQFQVSSLRKALGNDRDLIKTVCGRGYRFVAELTRAAPPTHAVADGAASAQGRLKQLETENAWLRRAVADLVVDKLILHQAAQAMQPARLRTELVGSPPATVRRKELLRYSQVSAKDVREEFPEGPLRTQTTTLEGAKR
jgi:DNA-binding winged helix-turn-helix (wHTH) protein